MKFHQMLPCLVVAHADQAIDFYRKVFGASEKFRLLGASDAIVQVELAIGFHTLLLASEDPALGLRAPSTDGAAPFTLFLQVDDVEALVRKAREADARIVNEPAQQFNGERAAVLIDPAGHRWRISQEIEEISAEEVQRRYTASIQTG